MKKETGFVNSATVRRGNASGRYPLQSLQEKLGATAEQIRKAIEKVGFDREKVEQYIKGHNLNNMQGTNMA